MYQHMEISTVSLISTTPVKMNIAFTWRFFVGFCLRPRSPPHNLVPFNGGVLGHCFRAMMNAEAFIMKGKSVIAMTQGNVSIGGL
jgi:hypothetical protein